MPASEDHVGAREPLPLKRLLEEPWDRRARPATRRALAVEAAASALFMAYAARRDTRDVRLLLPMAAVLMIVNHGRRLRIAESRRRLELAAHASERVERAVQQVGDALSARVDMGVLGSVVLEAALDAVSADSGYLVLGDDLSPVIKGGAAADQLRPHLVAAGGAAWANSQPYQLESDGSFAFAMPFSALGRSDGAVALARRGQPFAATERRALETFVRQVERAAADAATYEEFRQQALTDPLTGIGNRRKLAADLTARLSACTPEQPLVLALFDLDGFKQYNDRFGHPAGDALLSKLASQLSMAVSGDGAAYRLGGDEFCVLVASRNPSQLAAASAALTDRTTSYPVSPSLGSALLPREATTLGQALSLADKRMYQHKRGRARASRGDRHLFTIAG